MRTPMSKMWVALIALVAIVATSFAACGDDDHDKETESEGAKVACTGAAVDKASVKLPGDFPQPGELTITKALQAGPSQVIDGYWTSDLKEAYDEWHRELDTAGYSVLFDEIEEDDAEISYKSPTGRPPDRSRSGPTATRTTASPCTSPAVPPRARRSAGAPVASPTAGRP
jgi:hypothetical protein